MFRSSRLVSKYFRTIPVPALRSTHPYPFSINSVVWGRKSDGYGYRTPHIGLCPKPTIFQFIFNVSTKFKLVNLIFEFKKTKSPKMVSKWLKTHYLRSYDQFL